MPHQHQHLRVASSFMARHRVRLNCRSSSVSHRKIGAGVLLPSSSSCVLQQQQRWLLQLQDCKMRMKGQGQGFSSLSSFSSLSYFLLSHQNSTASSSSSSTSLATAATSSFNSSYSPLASLFMVGIAGLTLTSTPLMAGCEENEQVDIEQARRDEWDNFMRKAITPGEDDDDEDEDEEEDEEEEEEDEEEEDDDSEQGDDEDEGNNNQNHMENKDEEENVAAGPADEMENGGDILQIDEEQQQQQQQQQQQRVMMKDHSERQMDEQHDATESIPNYSNNESDTNTSAGPADEEEDDDVGTGYETALSALNEEEDDDEYSNLPEEDEPTTCTICIINRQGPCRQPWRKFERCMKDYSGGSASSSSSSSSNTAQTTEEESSSSSSNLASKCDKYMFPWLACLQQHRNTYTLITNKLYQEEFVDVIESDTESKILFEKSVDIDWSEWKDYVDKMGWTDRDVYSDTVMDTTQAAQMDKVVEWRAHDMDTPVSSSPPPPKNDGEEEEEGEEGGGGNKENSRAGEPVLIEARARIQLFDPSISPTESTTKSTASTTGSPIEIAYARDQDGNLLGFDQFTSEKKRLLQVSEGDGEGETKQEGMSELSTADGDGKSAALTFHIMPGVTRWVQIFALYKEEEKEGRKGGGEEKEEVGKEKSNKEEGSSNTMETPTAKKLYYSQPVPLVEAMRNDE